MPSPDRRRALTVATLGVAQTLAWASSYYLPAMLAGPIAADLGVSTPTIFAAFSIALLVSALLGPQAGHAIDRWGGRPVLVATNGVFAIGLGLLASATGPVSLFAAWIVIGIGMGSGLYEAAFSALVRLHGSEARGPITGITLIAGFASTVGWPLTAWLETRLGWRGACWVWAGLHLAIGIPLNASLPKVASLVRREGASTHTSASPAVTVSAPQRRVAALLSFVFAGTWFISTAMAAHFPRLLEASGTTLVAAVALGALVGPAQVVGRIVEFALLRRLHPLLSARVAALLHPIGAAALIGFGAPAAALFAILHGAGNGILTIAKGTLPLALFGADGYGRRQGLMTVPARVAQAAAPWLFGILLEHGGSRALWATAALGVTVFGALLLLPRRLDVDRTPVPFLQPTETIR